MNTKKYQIFTPSKIVKRMLDDIGYNGADIINKNIIDISCGDGAFVIEAARRYIQACKNLMMANSKIISNLCQHVFGCEIEKEPYQLCKIKLLQLLKSELGEKVTKTPNILMDDGLNLDESRQFDFVVGNPPYISYKDMSSFQKKQLSENFLSCKKMKYDYSYAFIEKSIRLLKNNGIGAIIAPINMYKVRSGELLRDFLKAYLYKIDDVTEENIFPGVLTNPVISYFKNDAKEKRYINIQKGLTFKKISFEYLYGQTNANFNKGIRFGDYYKCQIGVATLYNDAFIVGTNEIIEENITKKAYSPKSLRYGISSRIIFPYRVTEKGITKFSEEEFKVLYPNAYTHLFKFKDSLINRNSDKNAKWFEYGRSQAIRTVNQEKIMIPSIVTGALHPVLLSANDVVYSGIIITSLDSKKHPLSEAIQILQDKSLILFIKEKGVKMNKNSYRIGPKDLEDYYF